MRLLSVTALLTLAAGCTGASALAEEGTLLTGTLKTIKDRGTILIGYRQSSLPFSLCLHLSLLGSQALGFVLLSERAGD